MCPSFMSHGLCLWNEKVIGYFRNLISTGCHRLNFKDKIAISRSVLQVRKLSSLPRTAGLSPQTQHPISFVRLDDASAVGRLWFFSLKKTKHKTKKLSA